MKFFIYISFLLLISCSSINLMRGLSSSNSFSKIIERSLIVEEPKVSESVYREILEDHFDTYFDIVNYIQKNKVINIEEMSEVSIQTMLSSLSNYSIEPIQTLEFTKLKGISSRNLVIKLNDDKNTVLALQQIVDSTAPMKLIIGRLNKPDDRSWLRHSHHRSDQTENFNLILYSEIEGNPLGWNRIQGYSHNSVGLKSSYFSVPMANLQQIKMNPDRLPIKSPKLVASQAKELVTVLDSGVNYNLKEIAIKLFSGLTIEKEAEIQKRYKAFSENNKSTEKEALSDVLVSRGLGYDYFENDIFPFDYGITVLSGSGTDHGTSVAYRIIENNDDIEILPIRYLGGGADGDFYSSVKEFEKAVLYSKALGSRVINMSLTMMVFDLKRYAKILKDEGISDQIIAKEIKQKEVNNKLLFDSLKVIEKNSDILFVIASGNENDELMKNSDSDHYIKHGFLMKELVNVIIVASHDKLKELSKGTVYGSAVHVAAHGNEITTINAAGEIIQVSGASYAAPLVSKTAATVLNRYKSLTVHQAKKAIEKSVEPKRSLQKKIKWGGILNYNAALVEAKNIWLTTKK